MEERGIVHINRRVAETITALAILAVVIALFINSLSLPGSPMRGYPGPGFIPRMILIFTGIFALLWLGRLYIARWRSTHDPGSVEAEAAAAPVTLEYRDYIATIVAVSAFALGLQFIGFEITCFVILGILLYVKLGNPVQAVLMSAATMLFIYGIFGLLLGISLPLAFLPSYISF